MSENELILFDRLEIIKNTIQKYGEDNFYLSFSGGKDSTVLHYMLDEVLPNNKIPRVYINTGIEYNDILKFVRQLKENDDRIIIYNSNVHIPTMLKTRGYPFKSKEHSRKLGTYKKSGMCKTCRKYIDPNEISKFKCPKILLYQFSDKFDIKISDQCCYELKKKPCHKYENESGRYISILGLRIYEGGQRANHVGCTVFDKENNLKKFKPLNVVNDEFMDWYIHERNIKLCRLYYPPFNFNRTGCKGCPFSINLQEQLEVMDRLLPNERKQCEIIWKTVYEEYRRIGYRLKKVEERKLF